MTWYLKHVVWFALKSSPTGVLAFFATTMLSVALFSDPSSAWAVAGFALLLAFCSSLYITACDAVVACYKELADDAKEREAIAELMPTYEELEAIYGRGEQ